MPLENMLRGLSAADVVSLGRDEEVALIMRAKAGDTVATQKIVLSQLRWVRNIAAKMNIRRMPFDDRFQSGVLGVFAGIRAFDPSFGVRFNTYVTFWIRQKIMHEFKKVYMSSLAVPPNFSALQWLHATNRLMQKLERAPSVDEVMLELGGTQMGKLNDETFAAGVRAALHCHRESDSRYERDGDELDKLGLMESFDDGPPAVDTNDMVASLLREAKLKPKHAEIVRRRFGIGQPAPETLLEIGQALGVTRERIRQIEATALGKLLAAHDRMAYRERKKLQRTMFGDMHGNRARLVVG